MGDRMDWKKWIMEIGRIYDAVGVDKKQRIMDITEAVEQEGLENRKQVALEVLELCKKLKGA